MFIPILLGIRLIYIMYKDLEQIYVTFPRTYVMEQYSDKHEILAISQFVQRKIQR